MEEGQHSYMDISPYDPSNINFYDRLIKNWKNRFSEVDEMVLFGMIALDT